MARQFTLIPLVLFAVSGCGGGAGDPASSDQAPGLTMDLTSRFLANEAAYVPPQCYTKTIDDQGEVHNPCYACHIEATPPNYINDDDLQLGYSFPTYAETNRWSNLFADRASQIAAIGDEEILAYGREDNYFDPDGGITLARVLGDLPSGWDFDGDGEWAGFVPDCYFRFDESGFDHRPDGTLSGWRAFGYYPFLGTFWPANGSTDDVLIRLAEPFRRNEQGAYDVLIYKVNLAIVEAMIKRTDVSIEPADEVLLGVDLDKNGVIGGTAERVAYDWAPLDGKFMSYVGEARLMQEAGEVHLAAGLFPEGTEFLHSVRYIDPADDGQGVSLAPRMKELRYARKRAWRTYTSLQDLVLNEIKEKDDFPDRLREVFGNVEEGVSNNQGWVYQGFIEDASGELRPQSYEESVFCVGCHGGIGATTDGVFAFPRRFGFETLQHGWYHWSQKGLAGVPEPLRSDGAYEFTFYLENNGAGDEFRANDEIAATFFDAEGNLKADAVERLHEDISTLLFPSRDRALALNKAYRVIVRAQDFILGRDAMPLPPKNVHRRVDEGQISGVEVPLAGP